MKKITSGKTRNNLKYERVYEQRHKQERNAKKRITTKQTHQAKQILEKKIGRKLKKNESVDHIKPLALGGTNKPSNLRVLPRKQNFARGAKLKAKM